MKASLIPVLAVVALLVAMMAQLPPSMQSRVNVRFRIVSDVAVTKYSIATLANYGDPLAVFVRDDALYVAYRSGDTTSAIVRADTGGVVKTCSLGANIYIEFVAGRGTAYALVTRRIPGDYRVNFEIVDLWSCEILATFERALMPPLDPASTSSSTTCTRTGCCSYTTYTTGLSTRR